MKSLFLKKSINEINSALLDGTLSNEAIIDESEKAINVYEKSVHAWVHFDIDQVRSEFESKKENIKRLYSKNKISGLPFGIKDIFNTTKFATEMGSPTWKGFTPGNNARIVDDVIHGGGLAVGKTVTAEFAVHELNETKNPHDLERTPGTSSSGSAVAVATGMVPFSLATQTAGSIIRPASFCGVWGMKPSFGMIARTGILKTTDSLDTVGFLTTHGKNLRHILDIVRVSGPGYPLVFRKVDKIGSYPKEKTKKWKVGFVKTHIWENAEGYVKNDLLNFVDKLKAHNNFDVADIMWDAELAKSHYVHETIYNKSLSYYFQNEEKAGEKISTVMRNMINNGKEISISDYNQALTTQEVIADKINNLFDPYDFVISIGTSSHAPLRNEVELPDPSLIWTLSYLPSVAVPAFRSPQNLPFGFQITASRWKDYSVLQALEYLIDEELISGDSLVIQNSAIQ